jgi:hypothetical protein
MPQVDGKGFGVTCSNRLTVVGSKHLVTKFQKGRWTSHFKARFIEPLEWSAGRFVCQFETDAVPLTALKSTSRRSSKIVLMLDYENEEKRTKGLVKAKNGKIEQFEFSF